jgi:hypothetical protein
MRIRSKVNGPKICGGRAEPSVGACTGSLGFEARR